MSTSRSQLRRRAQTASGNVALENDEWNDLVNDGIRALWQTVVRINNDFRVTPTDFAITDTATPKQALPADFMGVRTVLRDAGLVSEQRLRQYGPRTGPLASERSYRLEGGFIVIEPRIWSVGNYRLNYTPQPPILLKDSGTSGILDVELDQFQDFVFLSAAVAALGVEDSNASQKSAELARAEARVIAWASGQRTADPPTVERVRVSRRDRSYMRRWP